MVPVASGGGESPLRYRKALNGIRFKRMDRDYSGVTGVANEDGSNGSSSLEFTVQCPQSSLELKTSKSDSRRSAVKQKETRKTREERKEGRDEVKR